MRDAEIGIFQRCGDDRQEIADEGLYVARRIGRTLFRFNRRSGRKDSNFLKALYANNDDLPITQDFNSESAALQAASRRESPSS
jgi:hypothetical protein